MEEHERLQERLRNFPKFTLEDNEKKRILYTLKSERPSPKRFGYLKPIFTIVGTSLILLFLLFTKEDFNNLTAEQGTAFILPDRDQLVMGIEGKIGVIPYYEHFIAEDKRRVAKLMLYFWGDANALVGKDYRVEAENTKGEKMELSKGTLSDGLYSEDAHTLTWFPPFPTEGDWQLSFYVEDKLFEAFTINVLPPFPKTEHFTLLDAPKEIPIGEAYEISVESTIGEKQKIEVKLLDKKGNVEEVTFFEQTGTFIDSGSLGTVYHYTGKITLKEHGTWRLLIDGEETGLFEN